MRNHRTFGVCETAWCVHCLKVVILWACWTVTVSVQSKTIFVKSAEEAEPSW